MNELGIDGSVVLKCDCDVGCNCGGLDLAHPG
jgi:hypothetical protein